MKRILLALFTLLCPQLFAATPWAQQFLERPSALTARIYMGCDFYPGTNTTFRYDALTGRIYIDSAGGSSPSPSGSGGTVSNFTAGACSPLFTTSVSDPHGQPALTFSLTAQSPNIFYAGPVSGGAASPTFRAIASGDLPVPIGPTVSGPLTNHSDVVTSGLAGGHILAWDPVTKTWTNGPQSASVSPVSVAFTNHNDVTITELLPGNTMIWDGSKWTNGSFSPKEVAGLYLWLDGSRGVYSDLAGTVALADGGTVVRWNDQSGLGNYVTNENSTDIWRSSGAPGNNGCVTFLASATGSFLKTVTSNILSQPLIVFAVLNHTNNGLANVNLMDGNNAGTANIYFRSNNMAFGYAGAGYSIAPFLVSNQWHQLVMKFNGVGSQCRTNEVAAVTGNAGAGVAYGFTIGSYQTGAGAFKGDIAEILVYTNAGMTYSQVEAIEAYLDRKYNHAIDRNVW